MSARNIDPRLARFRQLCGGGAVVRTLADIRRGEDERREAAGVLAQVLSPWIEGNTLAGDTGVQDTSLPDIVISLKGESNLGLIRTLRRFSDLQRCLRPLVYSTNTVNPVNILLYFLPFHTVLQVYFSSSTIFEIVSPSCIRTASLPPYRVLLQAVKCLIQFPASIQPHFYQV